MDRNEDPIDPFKDLDTRDEGQQKKCQYLCGDTKTFKIQSQDYPTDICPDKYAELISTGMLVCTEMTQTVIASSQTVEPRDRTTFNIPTLMFGMYEYQCEYDRCKRVFFDPDENFECPDTYDFIDVTSCTNAGNAVIDNDKMYIELEQNFD